MTNYIIPILFIALLIAGAVYKLLTKKDDTENKEVKETYKENTTSTRVINDHMAHIMNIKKKK
jgi:hypothetical protein